MSVATPAALAAVTARIGEIRSRLGVAGASAPAVTANGTAFASTLSQALGTGGGSDASSGLSSALSTATGGTGSTAQSLASLLGLTGAAGSGSAAATSSGLTGAAAGEKAVSLAKSYTGVPYLWGGTDPEKGLDCSGLVQLVFDRLGVDLPRTSAQQAKVGKKVDSLADARPGDLVFFGRPVHHVGVYAGDGMMVDAPRRGKTVGLHKVWDGVSAIRRVTPEAAQPGVQTGQTVQPTAQAALSALSALSGSGSATGSAASGSSVTLPGGASDSIDDLLTRLVRTAATDDAAGSTSTGATPTGATPTGVTTTVNALLAAARGYGPAAPGGVMGSAGAHSVTLPVAGATAAAATSPTTGTTATTATTAAGAGWRSQPYADLFAAAGRTHGVDPALLSAIAKAESGYRASAKSHAGAVGLMQIMPGTARDLGVDASDPTEAVDGAARLVARYLKSYDGDVDKVLAAYNAGPGAVKKYGGVPPYSETQTYVRRVTGYWEDLR